MLPSDWLELLIRQCRRKRYCSKLSISVCVWLMHGNSAAACSTICAVTKYCNSSCDTKRMSAWHQQQLLYSIPQSAATGTASMATVPSQL